MKERPKEWNRVLAAAPHALRLTLTDIGITDSRADAITFKTIMDERDGQERILSFYKAKHNKILTDLEIQEMKDFLDGLVCSEP